MNSKTKEIFIHILPVLMGIVITVILSAMVYHQMMSREEETSWKQLDYITVSLADSLTIQMQDNMVLLEQIADTVGLQYETEAQEDVVAYLQYVQKSTIFDRIDIVFPDDTIMHQDGRSHRITSNKLSYAELADRGVHYSPRVTDEVTAREAFYCIVPISSSGIGRGVLIGVVDCGSLQERIQTYAFNGTAQLYLVDCSDGSFLMDNWHDSLGNVYELERLKRLSEYGHVDIREEILGGKSGRSAFYSKVNGEASYISYTPVEEFNWSFAVAVQSEAMLANVHQLSATLQKIAVVEMLLLFSYLLWNIFVGNMLVKQRESVHLMELETATNEAKSVFLSSVSHDIRTPLNGILGMLDVLQGRQNDPRQVADGLEKIRISAEYLVTLADNVLELNDLESGKAQPSDDPIDLRKLKDELDILVQSKLTDSSVSYSMEYLRLEHPLVMGSDGYLHRILSNLIGNAIKYNKENGSVWVTVEELEAFGDGALYRFVVRDTGIGVSEDFRRRMFTAFEQEQTGARSKNTGHGLGLAIVDRMVKRMGGTIEVESVKGAGSAFSVLIPFRWQKESDVQVMEEIISDEKPDLVGAKVLLVEDNELNMEIAKILLTEAGADLTTAVNGKLALDAFLQSEPGYFDVILMDIMMPVMDGCEAAMQIRSSKRSDAAGIPMIAMTASTFAEDVKRCKDAGMNEHVAKPLDMKVVIEIASNYRRAYRKQ